MSRKKTALLSSNIKHAMAEKFSAIEIGKRIFYLLSNTLFFATVKQDAILHQHQNRKPSMKTSTYPTLGQRVTFIRQDLNNKETLMRQGEGVILGLGIDVHKRLTAHIGTEKADGTPEKVNVDIAALNPSDEFVAKFKAATEAVAAFQKEGNDKAAAVVAEYNGRIQEAYSGVLGEPVEVAE